MASDKPAVLIVGGLGYVGRFLALHIHQNDLASEIRLVDKVLPQLAWLAPEFEQACSQDNFMQADASREQTLEKIFTPKKAASYTYVFNCGGETRYSQEDSVYALRSTQLTVTLAKECAKRKIPAYVEFSTGLVYKPPTSTIVSSGGCVESSPLKPGPKLAKHQLEAEIALARIRAETEGALNYSILRLAHIYGDYESGHLSRALCMARVHQDRGMEMKFLYGKDMRQHTVHVLDVATAAWKAAEWTAGPSAPKDVFPAGITKAEDVKSPDSERAFNIADEGDTTQGRIADLIGQQFDIKTGFTNTLVSSFARFNLDGVADDVNDAMLQPWADLIQANLVQAKGITRTGPITPFMEKELLRDSDLCMSSKKAKAVLGWEIPPERKELSKAGLSNIIQSYEKMGWWP